MKYYNMEKCRQVVDKEHAHYIILMGGRNIGKSYQVKEYILRDVFVRCSELIYLRREREDISTDLVQGYFADVDVKNITDGQYDSIICYQHKLFFAVHGDEAHPELITEKRLFGYAHALRLATHYKSVLYPKVDDVIFEEFVPDGKPYLAHEPLMLQEYISTIFRTREGRCWMIGNTISKLNPYAEDWQLTGIGKMKTHQIDIYRQTVERQSRSGTETHEVKIVVECCGAEGLLSKMAFGTGAGQIVKNEYRRYQHPTVDADFVELDCEELYHAYMFYKNLKFKMQLMRIIDDDGSGTDSIFWYIKPAANKITIEDLTDERVITDVSDFNPLHTGLKPISQKEKRVFDFFTGKMFFADDMCGTDFKQCFAALLRA